MKKKKLELLVTHQAPDFDAWLAIWILRRSGEQKFPGISQVPLELWPAGWLPEGETAESLEKKGVLLVDTGKGKFDHHGQKLNEQKQATSCSDLVAAELGLLTRPELRKLLSFCRRQDIDGESIHSPRPEDHLTHLLAVIRGTNLQLEEEEITVKEAENRILGCFDAILKMEQDWLQAERDWLKPSTMVEAVETPHGKVAVAMIFSDSYSAAKYCRFGAGKKNLKADVVIVFRSTGHVQISSNKKTSLRGTAAFVRWLENIVRHRRIYNKKFSAMMVPEFHPEIPEWYLSENGKLLLNGSLTNPNVEPTRIKPRLLFEITKIALAQQVPDLRSLIQELEEKGQKQKFIRKISCELATLPELPNDPYQVCRACPWNYLKIPSCLKKRGEKVI